MSGAHLSDYDYELPPELIAQRPLERRDASRLLCLGRANGAVVHRQIAELPELLPDGALLIVNDTRVFPARLRLRRASGGAVEVLLIEARGGGQWLAMTRSSKRLREGEGLLWSEHEAPVVEVVAPADQGHAEVRLLREDLPWVAGEVPLPPYIRRAPDAADRERYQTVFAQHEGSVAAPTAGLHLSEGLLQRIEARGLCWAKVTLHVGPGTFAPVRTEDLDQHRMHEERYEVSESTAAAVAAAKAEGRAVIAVGTTSVRTLEATGGKAGSGRTALFIRPGFSFRVVDGLLTNFHLPRSTLLMLVSALAGREQMLAAYVAAVAERYRFFSYGDAMLIR